MMKFTGQILWGLFLFIFILLGCKKNHYHLMPQQKQFLSPFLVGSTFKMLKDKTDTVTFKVVKNEITTVSCERNCVSEQGYVKIVNQANENQVWEINMDGDDRGSSVLVKIDTISYFNISYRHSNDTIINGLEFNKLYKFYYYFYDYCPGIIGISPEKGFGYLRYICNGDTITYERVP